MDELEKILINNSDEQNDVLIFDTGALYKKFYQVCEEEVRVYSRLNLKGELFNYSSTYNLSPNEVLHNLYEWGIYKSLK